MPRKKKAEVQTEITDVEKVAKKEEIKETSEIEQTSEKTEKKEKTAEKKEKKSDPNMLVPVDDYIKYGAYLGTKVITAHMKQYVYRRRADGLAIFNTTLSDQKLKEAITLISKYDPADILICCKRRAGWNALQLLSKITGIKVFTKKYPAGIITNLNLREFFEPRLMFIIDPWLDKNPLKDAVQVNLPIVSICDTNNVTLNISAVIPCNNKSNKSIGLICHTIAKEYCKAKKIEAEIPSVEDFIGPDVI